LPAHSITPALGMGMTFALAMLSEDLFARHPLGPTVAPSFVEKVHQPEHGENCPHAKEKSSEQLSASPGDQSRIRSDAVEETSRPGAQSFVKCVESDSGHEHSSGTCDCGSPRKHPTKPRAWVKAAPIRPNRTKSPQRPHLSKARKCTCDERAKQKGE